MQIQHPRVFIFAVVMDSQVQERLDGDPSVRMPDVDLAEAVLPMLEMHGKLLRPMHGFVQVDTNAAREV